MAYDTARPYGAGFVIIRQNNKVVFVLRQNTDWMNGYYGLPSGKVEKGETFTECAIREAREEAGVTITEEDLRPVHFMHRKSTDDTDSWVDVYFEVSSYSGEVINGEPELHSAIEWLDLNDLPANIIPPVKAALENIKAGKIYSEFGWIE